MSLRLQWAILSHRHLPAKWKHALTVLALIAKDNGTSIFASEETIAGYLGIHRVTACRLLKNLDDAGLVVVTRRGGRWRTRKGVVGRCSERRFDIEKLRAYGSSTGTTSCPDLVATPLLDASDLVATPLHADADLVAPVLHIKSGKTLKTGSARAKTGRSLKGTDRMTTAVARDAGELGRPASIANSRTQQQQTKVEDPS
jgi:hypothetical protein